MTNPIFDPPDDSSSHAKYYLLKINNKSKIGDRDPDSSVLEYFDSQDIGLIQSTNFAQDLNVDEFKMGTSSPNSDWVTLLKSGTVTVGTRVQETVTWGQGASDAETEKNLADAIISIWNTGSYGRATKIFSDIFWFQVSQAVCIEANPQFTTTNKDGVLKFFEDISNGASTYTTITSGDVIFETRKEHAQLGIKLGNFIELFNDIIGDTAGRRDQAMADKFHNFGRVAEDFQTLRDQVIFTIGDVFRGEDRDGDGIIDTDILRELKDQTNTPHMISGIRQNYFLIKSLSGNFSLIDFTGLNDTPTGYESGKYLFSTSSGIEYKEINLGDSSLTGLLDTPNTYSSGKYLQSTASGVEWVDAPAGTGSSSFGGSSSFTGLNDTANIYDSGKFLISTDTGIEYGSPELAFLEDITDRPASELISGFLSLDKNRNLVWKTVSTTGDIFYNISGATHFTGLVDVPSGYQDGKFLKSTANGLEYVNISGEISSQEIIWKAYPSVSDLPPASSHHGMFAHVHNEGAAYMAHAGTWEKIYPQGSSSGSSTFKSLTDTPDVYSSGNYLRSSITGLEYITSKNLGKDIPVYPNSYNDINSLPSDPHTYDGELVKVGCELYLSCNGKWINTTSGSSVMTPQLPDCIGSLDEAVQYSEYRDDFLAKHGSQSFIAGFNEELEPLVIDVCMHIDSNNTLYNSDHNLKIQETDYKWGIFKNSQTINIEALTSSPNCTFSEWTSSSATFLNSNNSQTSLFIDTDTSITGSFYCLDSAVQVNCGDVVLSIQSDTTDGDTSIQNLATQSIGSAVTTSNYGQSPAHSTQRSLFGASSLRFNGSDNYFYIGNKTDFKFLHDGTSDYTIETWFFPELAAPNNQALMSSMAHDSNSDGIYFMLHNYGNNNGLDIQYNIFKKRGTAPGLVWKHVNTNNGPVKLNQWNHIAIVLKNSEISCYVNGSLQDNGTSAYTITPSPSTADSETNLHIGTFWASSYGSWLKGDIQDLMISKEALYNNNFQTRTALNQCI